MGIPGGVDRRDASADRVDNAMSEHPKSCTNCCRAVEEKPDGWGVLLEDVAVSVRLDDGGQWRDRVTAMEREWA
jgi:hypothetical protein